MQEAPFGGSGNLSALGVTKVLRAGPVRMIFLVLVVMKNVSHFLVYLRAWSLSGGIVWEGRYRVLGGTALLEDASSLLPDPAIPATTFPCYRGL